MLREYEFTMITSARLSEVQSGELLQKYEELFQREGGVIIYKYDMGVLRMAYPIKKQFRGKYTCYTLAVTPSALQEALRIMHIDHQVLRHLTVKLSDHIDAEGIAARVQEFAQKDAVEESEKNVVEDTTTKSKSSSTVTSQESGVNTTLSQDAVDRSDIALNDTAVVDDVVGVGELESAVETQSVESSGVDSSDA